MRYLLLLILSTFFFLNTGCTSFIKGASAFNKAVTFRNWELYKTESKYYYYDIKDNKIKSGRPSTLAIEIADDNSYAWPLVDFGSYIVVYKKVNRDTFSKDIELYEKFIEWSELPYEEREKSKDLFDDYFKDMTSKWTDFGFMVTNEKGSNKPFLVAYNDGITHNTAIALDEDNVKVILCALEAWKNSDKKTQE